MRKTISAGILFVFIAIGQQAFCSDSPAGRVVWWGNGMFWQSGPSDHTNGVLESNGEILTNIVAIAAGQMQAVALKSDGTVVGFGRSDFIGGNNVPPGLSNVVSVAVAGSSCWAIRRNGTVARWGGSADEENVVTGLSNVTAIASAGIHRCIALKNDGTLVGFRFGSPPEVDPGTGALIDPVTGALVAADPATRRPIVPNVMTGRFETNDTNLAHPVRVQGQILRDVQAIASFGETPLVLKRDGTVLTLGFQPLGLGVTWLDPSADPVILNGTMPSNVVALAGGLGHALALKRDGTVVAWGRNYSGETSVPPGLSNVIAIAAAEQVSMALKRDGTITAWGANHFAQTSPPAGLSNVTAIAAGGWFSLALTTGNAPAKSPK